MSGSPTTKSVAAPPKGLAAMSSKSAPAPTYSVKGRYSIIDRLEDGRFEHAVCVFFFGLSFIVFIWYRIYDA